jgi:hypothetical protein
MSGHSKHFYNKENYIVDNDGVLYYTQKTKEGTITAPVSNHAPMLVRILRKDDGFNITEQVEFSARRKGEQESPVCIDKKTMIGSQPQVNFSPGCRIYIGRGNTAHYSEFMQMQCEDADIEMIYSHTGWIKTADGQRVFLNGSNSVCKDGLTTDYVVELDPDFKRFCFYPVDDGEDDCFRTVITDFQKAVPSRIYVPLIAYTFMTPLNEMLRSEGKEPCFSFYLIGKTGSFKSSISKLILCFFGLFNYADTSPVTFLDTQNAIGRKLAIGADLPLLLDDRRPTNNAQDKNKYEGIEKYVSSAIGDRAARGRLNADSTAKFSYIAKSNLIVTAEEAFVNIGSSSIARSVSVEIQPDSIDFDGLQNLQEKPQRFNKVMQLYIQWIINHYEQLRKDCGGILRKYRNIFSNAGHARLATAFSQMMYGYHAFLSFCKDRGQIDDDTARQMIEQAQKIFLDMCDKQSRKVESEKPTNLFCELLNEMLETRQVTVVDLDKCTMTDGVPTTSQRTIGYRDSDYFYLMKEQTYRELVKFYGESGYTFPASKSMLWKMLADEGKSVPDVQKDGTVRTDKRKKIGNKTKWYIWLRADVLTQYEESDSNE